MGHSQAEKAKNRDRILNKAAAQIRDHGLQSLSVGKAMGAARLTDGGFYGHFPSRADFLVAALKRALLAGEAHARAAAPEKKRSFAQMVKSYLSRAHRDGRKTGCAIAALAGDAGRADVETRRVMAEHIEAFVAQIADARGEGSDEKAIVAVSAMVGALTLSRVITDPKRADAFLRITGEHLLTMA